jgi:carbamoyltransferase
MTSTLGLAYGYHDSAIALVDETEILYAAHEERFTRIKFDNSFPVSALKDLGKTFDLKKLKNVVYYEKPFKKFERQINSLIQLPLRDLFSFPENVASLRKLFQTSDKYINKQLKNTLEIKKQLPVYYSSHHRSHAAASFYTSEFESSLILVADAVGEFESTSLWIGKGNVLTQIYSQNFPNSYGIFYSALTSLLGFKVNTGEFKLMGLAPYGEPTYLETLQNVITLNDDNSMTLNPKYINPFSSRRLFTKKLETLLGTKMRKDSEALLQKHANIAISSQKILENQIITLVSRALENFNLDKLCVSGAWD